MSLLYWSPKQLCSLFGVDWDNTQLCSLLPELEVPKGCSISGGAIVRTLLGQDMFKGDVDIFAHKEDALRDAITKYSTDKTWTKSKYAYNFELTSGVRKTKVQVITRDNPSIVNETLKNFDFEHCKFSLYSRSSEITIVSTRSAPTILAMKQLRLGLVRDPNYTLGRAIKYKRLGFDADKVIEQLVAMQMKGMKDIQCCNDKDWAIPIGPDDIDDIIASASS